MNRIYDGRRVLLPCRLDLPQRSLSRHQPIMCTAQDPRLPLSNTYPLELPRSFHYSNCCRPPNKFPTFPNSTHTSKCAPTPIRLPSASALTRQAYTLRPTWAFHLPCICKKKYLTVFTGLAALLRPVFLLPSSLTLRRSVL